MARRRIAALLGSISLVALTAPAYAAIETVVVTAEKRAEDVRVVPMSVTVLGGEKLEREAATNFADYINSVPGMNYTASDPGHTQLILRGINAGGVGSTVGTYVDETPYGSSSSLANGTITTPNLDTFDIARVEVLRGPQGTIYGSSTLGGLLKFVTNAPDPSAFAGKIEVGVSDIDNGGNGYSAKGMLNIPIGERVAFRVSAYHTMSGGYIDDPLRGVEDVNSVRETGGRASVLFNLTDDLSVRLTGAMQNLRTGNDSAVDFNLVGLSYVPKYGKYQQQRIWGDPGYARYRIYNGTVNDDLGWATLTSSTSYDTFHDAVFQDATGVLGAPIDGHLRQGKFTQELRLASPADAGPLEWLAGFYYTNEVGNLHQDVVLFPGGAPLLSLDLSSQYVETAGFANLTYHFSEAFDVALGGRYSHNSQSAVQTIGGTVVADGVSDGNVFTWSVAPRYHLNEDTMVYGRVAKGYRPGGPNVLPLGGGTAPKFYGPDSLINYEVGVKTNLLDNTLSVDVAAFYIDWSDIQLLIVAGVPPTSVNANGGKASSKGVEWNFTWYPTDGLTLAFNGAYTDAHLTENTDPLTVGALSGAPLPWSPKWNMTVDGDYDFGDFNGFTPFIGGTYRHVGNRPDTFDPGSPVNQFPITAYDTFDLRAGVEWDRWALTVYGKNLGNAYGITAFGQTGISAGSGNAATGAVITPRTVGATLRVKF